MSKFPTGSLQTQWIYTRGRVVVNVETNLAVEAMRAVRKTMLSRLRVGYAALLFAEFCVTVTTLALCAWGYPDRFRTKLWENGGAEGWNSDPKKRIYYYANYEEPPEVPLVWSQKLTDSQLGIAALSLIIFLVRVGIQPFGYLPRIASILYDILLSSLWIWVLVEQNSADHSDPKHPSLHPWYLRRSCSDSWSSTRLACRVAQSNFVISILATIVYLSRLALEAAKETRERWGQRKHDGWSVLVDGESYEDGEEMGVVEDDEAQQIYDVALSPVLAFFPESAK